MSKDNTQDELKTAVEQCFIKNNMCDCGEVHTGFSIDDTEYFDVGNVVEDIQSLVKSEVRQVLDRLLSEQETFSDDLRHNQAVKVAAIEAERKRYE